MNWLSGLVSASPLTYLLITGLAIADIIGVVPAETVIVSATVLAMQGPLLIIGIVAAAIVGAVIGDNILYHLGRGWGGRLVGRLFRSQRSRRRLDWAQRQMHRHRNGVILGGRFVPAGRTAVMFAAGMLEVPWRRFIVPDVVSILLWTSYWVGITVLFGQQFSGRQWLVIALSVGIAVVLGGIAEIIRRVTERREEPARQPSEDR